MSGHPLGEVPYLSGHEGTAPPSICVFYRSAFGAALLSDAARSSLFPRSDLQIEQPIVSQIATTNNTTTRAMRSAHGEINTRGKGTSVRQGA